MPTSPSHSRSTTKDLSGSRAFLSGSGELARLIADHDWSRTALGTIEDWPGPLRTVVGMILRSPQAIVTLWGEPGVMIYNDAYAVFAGARHPGILGMDVLDAWPEAADLNRHVMNIVYHAGGTLEYRDQPLKLRRAGRPDEAWLDLTYSPVIGRDGTPLGVIAIVIETTERVRADRQLDVERQRLRQMYDQSPSFMALLDGPGHRIVVANAAYNQLIGHREVIGQTIAEALPEAAEQGYLQLLDSVYRSGEALVSNGARYDRQVVPDGVIEPRFVDFVFQPIRGHDGAVNGIFVNGVDVTDRVAAQESIRQSEAQFRLFAQAMPNHVWTAPPDGVIDWFNDRVIEYTGYDRAALLADGWIAVLHPDDIDASLERWSRSLVDGFPYEAEFRIRGRGGLYRWHLARAAAIRGDDGRIIRWIGSNTDIHDKKLAEAETTRDRDRLWRLSRDFMLVCDMAGTITAVNPAATRMLGWQSADMIGRSITGFIHPGDVPASRAELAKLAGGAWTLAFENRYRRRDGSYRLLDWTAVPDIDCIHWVGRDITEQRALARERDRVWALSPVVKLIMALDGTVQSVNPSWTQILGWSEAETLGRSVFDFVDPAYQADASDNLTRLAAGEVLSETRSLFRGKAGERKRIAFVSLVEDGRLYAFGRDVTAEAEAAEALAQAEEALRQSQKMEVVGQLTGGIAHDFNNLLQGITGSLEIVQRRIAQGRLSELDRFVTGATTAANRAAALTHRLLAFSRRQPLDPRPVRANPLIASMEDLLRRTIGEKYTLELVLAAGLWPTLCDPNQLENAVLNLAINARDAMPDGGQLTIETCNAHLDDRYAAQAREVTPGQYICICVTDTGTGMSADTIAKAFEPFFTTKPIGQGTGLGLSMIYGFARQSEGYTKIYSEEGTGTTVKLYLPRYLGEANGVEEVPRLGDAHATDAGEVVLVVEDEPVVRGLIVETLSELGYYAIEAADGPKGVEMLQSRRRIDLLITDIGLPGLNGRQVADAGRALRPGLKVLFMTGYAENAALASGFLEHGMSMITKPFAMEALATRIRAIVESE